LLRPSGTDARWVHCCDANSFVGLISSLCACRCGILLWTILVLSVYQLNNI
jgi:hypothetical protein